MAELSNDHINYIIKDLNYRGIVAEGIQEELIDHICTAVETEMATGKKFIDAYQFILISFGHTVGLRETQKLVIQSENSKPKNMLKNYLTIALRNLRKQSFYSFINIGGLAVGIAACLVIVLFIMDELSYDKYNTKADRIYRIDNEIKFGGNYYHINTSSAPAAHTLLQDYPEIESTVRFRSYGSYLVKTGEGVEAIKESNVIWAEVLFLKSFRYLF